MKRLPLLLAIALAATPLAAQPRKSTAQPAKLDPFPIGEAFRLVSINGKPVSGNLTLKVDGTYRGSGSSGCNNWSAAMYPLRNGRLGMGAIAMTRRACPAPVMALERRYLTALHSGLRWSTPPGGLILSGPAGKLIFQRAY